MTEEKLKTIIDLQAFGTEHQRIELIDGEIVKRPMARAEHALIQSGISGQFFPLSRKGGSPGSTKINLSLSNPLTNQTIALMYSRGVETLIFADL